MNITDTNLNLDLDLNPIIKPIKKLKIAHIFVHLFEIGGGEAYLHNFCKYSNYENILFINNQLNTNTLFNFTNNNNSIETILYNSYEELNYYLSDCKTNYNLILDHQLYWFDFNYSKIAFNNIIPNKIIRITHCVPIHYKNISSLNYYYSVELYNEKQSNNSWNNHIKMYNDIGVNIEDITENNIHEKIKIFEDKFNDKIDIAIIGRINEDKIPINFLKVLFQFFNNKNNNKYIFHFYGTIDKNYSMFIKTVCNNNLDNQNSNNQNNSINPNIIYEGIIQPELIKNIYKQNDILLHPSKNEAGATVILEAMSYGLPVIARHVGGVPNALNNIDYLCNNEKDMFDKLLSINDLNYKDISLKNYSKIQNNNNLSVQLNKLYNELEIIDKINELEIVDKLNSSNSTSIPNIIHYIYGLEKQKKEFPFVFYLSILSNLNINKPDKIYFHYQYLPYGYWWDKIKDYISLNYINTDNLYWGKKKIIKYAHKADKLRLDLLYKYGGIYMDIDTITYKSYHHLLQYDLVLGIQEENYGKDKITLYCNAIIFSKKNNPFLKEWINNYESYFDNESWCESSIHLLSKLVSKLIIDNNLDLSNNNLDLNKNNNNLGLNKNKNNTIGNYKILEKEAFYYPSYNEINKIFEGNEDINDKLITLHYWNSYSNKYYNTIKDFNWCTENNSMFSKIIKNLI
jgi:glycosyltransferase involved in cell wall biosynthesis